MASADSAPDGAGQRSTSQLGRLDQEIRINVEPFPAHIDKNKAEYEAEPAVEISGQPEVPVETGLDKKPHACLSFIGKPETFEGNSVLLRTTILGVVPTLIWRVLCAIFFFSVGICWQWSETDWSYIPAPVYLTHWGAAITTTYFVIGAAHSLRFVFATQCEERRPEAWSALSYVQMIVFETALILELAITGLYWALVYDGSCGFGCIAVHALAFVALFVEFWIAGLPVMARHVAITVIYPAAWIISQALWVHTGHDACYKVLSMADAKSAIVALLAFIGFVLFHMVFALLLVPLRRKLHYLGRTSCGHSTIDSYWGILTPSTTPAS